MNEKKLNSVIDYAREYANNGLTVIPVSHKGKQPIKGLKLHDYWGRMPIEEELNNWFPQDTKNGIGIILKDGLMGIDIDDVKILKLIFSKNTIKDIARKTWVSQTSDGFHVYFKLPANNAKNTKPIIVFNAEDKKSIEVYFNRRFFIESPSIHSSGFLYNWLTDIKNTDIRILDDTEAKALINNLERYVDFYPLIDYMIPKWKDSIRHDIIMFLGAALKKGGVELDDATWIIDAIATGAGDNDHRGRISTMKDNYSKQTADLKGYTGLKDLFGEKDADKILTYLPSNTFKINKFLTTNDAGNITGIDEGKLVEALMEDYIFLTFEDSEEILFYDDGVYSFGGESLIKKECEARIPTEHAVKYLTRHIIDEIIGHIQRLTYVKRKEFENNDHNLIILDNGIIDVTTGEFKEHSKDILALSKMPIKYDPAAVCPHIEKFIGEIINEDELLLLQEFTGYCLYPDLPTHKSFWCYGNGRNGKDTFFALLSKLIGEDNISNTDISTLENNKFAPAGLYGKALNISGEVSPKSLYRMNVFKALTGGTPIYVERKFGHAFKFKYRGKIVVFGNKMPKIFEDTVALWERIMIVRFPYEFLDNDPRTIKNLSEQLSTPDEMSGFLNWALAGLKRLKNNNWMFSSSKTADEMKAEFLKQSNPMRDFFNNRCFIEKGGWESTTRLYTAYIEYCDAEGLDAESYNWFGRKFGNMPGTFGRRKTINGKKIGGWQNIVLKDEYDVADKNQEPRHDVFVWNQTHTTEQQEESKPPKDLGFEVFKYIKSVRKEGDIIALGEVSSYFGDISMDKMKNVMRRLTQKQEIEIYDEVKDNPNPAMNDTYYRVCGA